MGTKVAPTVANLVMGKFEKDHVYTYHLQPRFWGRFIDDICALWTHGRTELDRFVAHLNTCHPTIKFTVAISDVANHFLDTTVLLDDNGIISTTVYTKPTDAHMYLHFQSCHPSHQKRGSPYSQLLRIKRICSKETDFLHNAKRLLQNYSQRGYPDHLLSEALDKALSVTRDSLLETKEKDNSQSETPLFCILPYSPNNPPVKQIVDQYWPIIEADTTLSCLYDKRTVIGHTRAKNLRDSLVHSRLRYPPPPTPAPTDRDIPNPTKVCKNASCRYCPLLDHSGKVLSTTTGRYYIVPQWFTCRFNNLIYCITCRRCNSQYVGQTKLTIMSRFQKHLLDIRHCQDWANAPPSAIAKGPTNVGFHFSRPNHNIGDVRIQVLELIRLHPDSDSAQEVRDRRERHWMHRLKTLNPFGLNGTDGSNQLRNRPNRSRMDTVRDSQA